MKGRYNPNNCLGQLAIALLSVTHAAAADLTPAPFFAWEKEVANSTLAPGHSPYDKYLAFANSNSGTGQPFNGSCKVFPGDATWPSSEVWQFFNDKLGGGLIQTVPLAHDCYNTAWGEYDASQCAYISSNWNISFLHTDDPSSVAWPLFQGRTCLPDGINVTDTCTLGGTPSYVVNVSTTADVQLAVNFARNAGIRLIVKNTGHDFGGRSTGAGALSIWTHNLKDLTLIDDYTTPSYSGKAIHIGAGIQVYELYEFAEANGVTAIGGECDTVGVAGGYILGGGHSPLSSIYGMAADHVLALNVVLPSGGFVTASETSHPELFWALRGGGGSTFGVVTSVTVKALPSIPVTISTFSFATGANVTADAFWRGVRAYFDHFLANADAGTYAYWWVIPTGPQQFLFQMRPFFAPNHTVPQFEKLVAPWFAQLRALGISVAPNTTHYASFYGAWNDGFEFESVGNVDGRSGSRLFPRDSFADQASLDATFNAIRNTTENAGAVLLAFNMKNAAPAGAAANAVNTHWRDSYLHACAAASWPADASAEAIAREFDRLTYEVFGQWRAVSPGGGAYANEADIQEPNWQEAFFGENYARLAALKEEVDPWGVFYAPTAVGSEAWEVRTVDGLKTQNGRLCRKG